MASLLRAFPPKATFIAVGDHLQLPSVGAGSVLKSVIDSKTLNVVQLDEVKRQGARSKIIEACDRISRGESIDWAGGQDFLFIEEDDPNKALEIVIALATKDLPAKYGADPFLDIQVIAPMKKGSCGVDRLNKEMQQSLNRRGRPVTDTLRIGDRVMQTRNNYSKECFNGDLGIIKGVIPDEGIVTVDFDGRPVRYEMKELGELQLAYSQTVHKSQGNEYPIVIMPILNQFYPMLARNLIYTGISRAKQLMVLVGSKQAISIAVRNDKIQKRHTRLDERLKLANRN
jgi:exodeoxyribonuclease V alpha subunit